MRRSLLCLCDFRLWALLVSAMLLTSCASLFGDPVPTQADPAPAEESALPESPVASTPIPTEVPRETRVYQPETGVFTINIPTGWEALDLSSGLRLLTVFVPPAGYGSRVTVDVTNEGPLPPDDVRALAESYVHLNYAGGAYTEISQDDLPDGRIQFVFLYDDGRGASGRETLYIQQAGPYFSALRIFLSESDTYVLSHTLEAITASYAVDTLAVWGSSAAAVNPQDLVILNTSLWQDEAGMTYYQGEIYNFSAADIAGVQVRVALCGETGVVMADVVQPSALAVVPAGGSAPFAISAAGLPADISVCTQTASALPAQPDPTYTAALALDSTAGYNAQRQIVIQGEVQNPGLADVASVEIVLVIYDASGRVVGMETLALGADVTLAPGASQAFEYTFPALGAPAERFNVLAQARVLSTLNPSLLSGDE